MPAITNVSEIEMLTLTVGSFTGRRPLRTVRQDERQPLIAPVWWLNHDFREADQDDRQANEADARDVELKSSGETNCSAGQSWWRVSSGSPPDSTARRCGRMPHVRGCYLAPDDYRSDHDFSPVASRCSCMPTPLANITSRATEHKLEQFVSKSSHSWIDQRANFVIGAAC